jgi:ArsR family transcriptional regulator, arsenate/arsenite/antimonite-responsive transcriptional repressor / arsenate reductase (thioredoxin)
VSLPAETALPGPPDFLRLVGHPVRWRLLSELARCDRTVRELCGLVAEPQNLVSYHLGKLRREGLVVSRRSSADGRDTYYRADLDQVGSRLAATGAALHPALQLVGEPPAPTGAGRARVLFLCSGNSARSQMAEALANARSGGAVEAHSAGLRPKPLHPNAVRVMREHFGIDIAGQRSKLIDAFAGQRFDEAVSLCDLVRAARPALPGHPETVHWSMVDPSAGYDDDTASYPAFERTASELETRVRLLLAVVGGPPDPFRPPQGSRDMTAPDPTQLVNVRYMVDDVDKALDFYTTHLGFTVRMSAAPAFADVLRGNLRLLLSGPASSAGRPMADGEKPGPGGWNRIHLHVDDIAAEVERLKAEGVPFRNDIVSGPGGQQVLIEDPSGNFVELFQPA